MPTRPKIGEYRHTPAADFQPTAGGALRATRVRRRFPMSGLVLMAYGMLGPLACALVSVLLGPGGARYLPQPLEPVALPPAPSFENLLFRAGVPEVVLASAVAGGLLWRLLWRVRLPAEAAGRGPWEAARRLIGQALVLGPVCTLLVMPLALYGFCVRGAPRDVPWAVRFLFAIPGSLVLTLNYLGTLIVPAVVVGLGLLMGAATALGVAFLWQQFPEEPIPG